MIAADRHDRDEREGDEPKRHVQMRPPSADEADLRGQQHHPAAEGKSMNLQDQRSRIIGVPLIPLHRSRNEPHQNAQPAQCEESEEEELRSHL